MNPAFREYKRAIENPLKFKWFLLTKVPAALIAGLKLREFSENKAVCSVKYRWLNTNPFRSMYFAVLFMAGELSTAVLCMAGIYKRNPSISMLLVKSEGIFVKKAVGCIEFTCVDGEAIDRVVEEVIATGEGKTIQARSTGKNENGEVVAELSFTWSFKERSSNKK
jgi:hypothetical protein